MYSAAIACDKSPRAMANLFILEVIKIFGEKPIQDRQRREKVSRKIGGSERVLF